MDVDHFDALTRSLSGAPSRRALLGGLLAGGAAHLSLCRTDILAKKGKGKAKGKAKGGGKGKGKKASGGGNQGVYQGQPTAPALVPAAAECTLPPESCDGCCQDGQCLPGSDHGACGQRGAPCQNCTAQATICTAGRTCGCDPAACDGCCVGGVCQSGDQDDACGSGGVLCHPCPDGYVCRQGVCCGEEGATSDLAPEALPYIATCCDGLLRDVSGICAQDCSRVGCPSGSECCQSSGECFSSETTNCRHGDGRLFQCEPGFICCQAPDGRAECGTSGVDGCASPFMQVLPATCPEWVRQPTTPSTASLQSGLTTTRSWWRRFRIA